MALPLLPAWLVEHWLLCALEETGANPMATIAVDALTMMRLTVHDPSPEGAFHLAARAAMCTAAPALVRDALRTEWIEWRRSMLCPSCMGPKPSHHPACPKSTALGLAGFPDQESREAAREMLRRLTRT